MAITTLAAALASKSWSSLIKQLDAALEGAGDGTHSQLLLNRSFCLQQLGLFRRALKDYEAVLAVQPAHPAALLNKAKVHVVLKQLEEAQGCLEELRKASTLTADVAVLVEGQLLAAALAAGDIKEGAKLPLLPAIAPPAPPPALPPAAPAAAKPASGFASGFLASVSPAKPAASAAAAPAMPAASAADAVSATAAGAAPPPALAQDACGGAAATTAASSCSSREVGGLLPSAHGLDPLHKLVARTDANQGVGLAVQLVNGGRCQEAISMLDLLLHHHPANVGAYAARGTARALLGQLREAVGDFSAAIDLEPCFADFVKRRGQALAALGEDEQAMADIRRSIELSSDNATKADGHEELGRLHQKAKDYRRAEAEFRVAAKLAPNGPSVDLLSALGLCQVSQGDLQDGIATYEAALQREPESKDLWLNLGMACKELCWAGRAEQALRKAAQLAKRGGTAVHAYRLLAQMKQGLGDHLGAVQELNHGIAAADKETQRIELRFLRGACHHAVGLHRQAVDDYQQTLEAQDALGPDASAFGELVSFICLAFYQKEMALYVRKNLDRHVHAFCVDADLHPEFKELWCKKGPPSAEFVSMYRAIMQPQHPTWSLQPPQPPPQLLAPLIEAADAVGKLVQYSHQGFLPNRRQQRMAGLAAIEFAQALQQLAADRRAGHTSLVDNAGASVSARRDSRSGQHRFGWRDAMDIIVRWRQLAEPNDQVIWVDLLTEREFNAGFGSHTPMFTGQTKCVRYYMVFHRALALLKRVLAAKGRATDANNAPVELDTEAKLAAVAAAETVQQMWQVLGTDSWAVVPIESTTRPGHTMEGTRLTVVNMSKTAGGGRQQEGRGRSLTTAKRRAVLKLANGMRSMAPAKPAKPRPQPDAYEFSIRTPVTPARWEDYDQELAGLFDRMAAALAERDLAGTVDASLRFAYYWYNFMPLARGSAFCGYVSILGTLMAAGAPVRSAMPKDYQADWEAILESSPANFIASLTPWLLPPELARARRGSGSGSNENGRPLLMPPPCKPVDQLPRVIEVLHTMRARLEALNGGDTPRI